ncbi:MAG: hypothetical protein JNJ88_02035 [Planctomycetes bacterium]|nr:hypothetical protein [Planctomycetota bacterium]
MGNELAIPNAVVGNGRARSDSAAHAPPDEASRCRFVIARGKPRAMVRRVRRPYKSIPVHAKTDPGPIPSSRASVKSTPLASWLRVLREHQPQL